MKTPANDNDPFAHLPMFASDLAIATAIVGSSYAKQWLTERLPSLEERYGFPKVDPVHKGRPVPLVRKFYEGYFGFTNTGPGVQPAVEGEWRGRKRRD